jgi:hypothetical protein
MGRRIVWYDYESSESAGKMDGYFDRLLKYIPSDVVGVWLTGSGLIKGEVDDGSRVGLLWLLFVAGLVLSFFWTRKQTHEAGKPIEWRQVLLSCGSFLVWVFAIGGPFAELDFYTPILGSIILLIYTAVIPFLPPPRVPQQ